MFSEGQHSFTAVLNQLLLVNFAVLEETGLDSEETGFLKKLRSRHLRHLYTCLYWEKSRDKEVLKNVVEELFSTDLSQLTDEERAKVPPEYIKQLCFIDDSTTPISNQELQSKYKSFLIKRLEQKCQLDAYRAKDGYLWADATKRLKKRAQQSKKPDHRNEAQIVEEGKKVTELLQMSSVVPEQENLPYYIISMAWFKDWQAYTGCQEQEDSDEQEEPALAKNYPGPVNQDKQLVAILDLKRDGKIQYDQDFFDGWHLKRGTKEDQHYKVVDREVWEILLSQYGGRSVPRISVAVQTEDPLRPDYIVEIEHRQFEVVNFPKVKYFQDLMELEARVSRADTVKEALAKIAASQSYARRS